MQPRQPRLRLPGRRRRRRSEQPRPEPRPNEPPRKQQKGQPHAPRHSDPKPRRPVEATPTTSGLHVRHAQDVTASWPAPWFCSPTAPRKRIEKVRPGDSVVATDPASGKTEDRQVTHTIRTDHDKVFVDLTVRAGAGNHTITTTEHHPFWSMTRKRWVDAGDLNSGERLLTSGRGHAQVGAIRQYDDEQRTYDLAVDTTHAYYVLAGTIAVLVHNCGSGPAAGVLEVSSNVKSTKAFENYSPSRGGIEYVFDPTANRLLVGAPKAHLNIPGSPHQQLARAGGLDESKVLGGIFRRDANGNMTFDESSGHYGERWTDGTRQQFAEFLNSFGFNSTHEKWW